MVKTKALVVAHNNFSEQELQIISGILRRRGVIVALAALTRAAVTGRQGRELEPDIALGEATPAQYDALIFINGAGVADELADRVIFKIIHDFQTARKVLAAIGDAPIVLANAGVLIGRTVTGLPDHEQHLLDRGGWYTGMPLEVDQLIVTAGPDMAERFADRLAYLLGT